MNKLKTEQSKENDLTHKFWVIIPAAGVGARLGASIPKQYLALGDKTVLEQTVSLFKKDFEKIVIAVSKEDEYSHTLASLKDSKVMFVHGGPERSDTVLNALEALSSLASDEDFVFVHDAARPLLSAEDLHRLKQAVLSLDLKSKTVGALLVSPVVDTLKRVQSDIDNHLVTQTVERNGLYKALTPQVFPYGILKKALFYCAQNHINITDDASAMEAIGFQSKAVIASSLNLKITLPQDYTVAKLWFENNALSNRVDAVD